LQINPPQSTLSIIQFTYSARELVTPYLLEQTKQQVVMTTTTITKTEISDVTIIPDTATTVSKNVILSSNKALK